MSAALAALAMPASEYQPAPAGMRPRAGRPHLELGKQLLPSGSCSRVMGPAEHRQQAGAGRWAQRLQPGLVCHHVHGQLPAPPLGCHVWVLWRLRPAPASA